jgi:hypothetical protein
MLGAIFGDFVRMEAIFWTWIQYSRPGKANAILETNGRIQSGNKLENLAKPKAKPCPDNNPKL